MRQSYLHLITEDGVTQILVTSFTDDEWKALVDDGEPDDPEPPGLELFEPEVPFSEN